MYKTDLQLALEDHAQLKKCKSSDYMNLYFKVKWSVETTCKQRQMGLFRRFYGAYVSELSNYKDSIPEFPAWFIPFVMQWLNENDELSMDFLRNAYDRCAFEYLNMHLRVSVYSDKKDNFPKSSDHTKFSNSVVDIFTQLTQGLDVISKMECPNPEVKTDMMRRFAKTVNKVRVWL